LKIFPKKSPLTFSDPPPGKCKKAPIPRKFSDFRTREWKNLPPQYLAGGPKNGRKRKKSPKNRTFSAVKIAKNPGKIQPKQPKTPAK
jgi:hypothetical protein